MSNSTYIEVEDLVAEVKSKELLESEPERVNRFSRRLYSKDRLVKVGTTAGSS